MAHGRFALDHSVSIGVCDSVGRKMYFQSNRFSTVIWGILITLTLITYMVGEIGLAGKGVMLLLLLIAFTKGQMVANYFMGLRAAGWLWRAIIIAYFLIVGGLIAIAYLVGLQRV